MLAAASLIAAVVFAFSKNTPQPKSPLIVAVDGSSTEASDSHSSLLPATERAAGYHGPSETVPNRRGQAPARANPNLPPPTVTRNQPENVPVADAKRSSEESEPEIILGRAPTQPAVPGTPPPIDPRLKKLQADSDSLLRELGDIDDDETGAAPADLEALVALGYIAALRVNVRSIKCMWLATSYRMNPSPRVS